ncbi:MAG: hypothetical protein NT020_08830 [Chloroflexales bacterium]|nr:hypothetical protein [Chloroflexales bacterium]
MDNQQRYKIEEIIWHELRTIVLLIVIMCIQKIFLANIFGVSLNLLLLLVVLRTLIEPIAKIGRWALYGGLIFDSVSGAWLGMHSIGLILAAVTVFLLLSRITSENWILPIVAVIIGSLVYYFCNGVLLYVLVRSFDVVSYITTAVIPDILIILVPALPMFLLLRWLRSMQRGELPLDVY